MHNQTYYYLGSYLMPYNISNPNLYNRPILVNRNNTYGYDYSIYLDENFIPITIKKEEVTSFETNNKILPLNNFELAKCYEYYYPEPIVAKRRHQ